MSRVGLSSQCCAPGRGESGAPRSSCNGTAGFWVRQGDGSQDGGRNGPSHNAAVPLLIALIISRQTAPDWAEVFPDRSHWGKRVYSGSFLNRRTVHYTNAMFSFTSTRQNVFWKTFFFCSNIVRRIWLNPLMKTTSFVKHYRINQIFLMCRYCGYMPALVYQPGLQDGGAGSHRELNRANVCPLDVLYCRFTVQQLAEASWCSSASGPLADMILTPDLSQ